MQLRRQHVFVAFFVIASTFAPATHAQRVHAVARLGLDYGGEKVIQFEYDDGSTPDVIAGGGLIATIGAVASLYAKDAHAVEAQGNVGVKYRTIPPAGNQDATWLRFPVEAMLAYRAPTGIRIGAGATMHFNNVLSASGAVLNDRVEFETSPGFFVQGEYLFQNYGVDVRYTALKYKISSGGAGSVDASSIGAGFSFYFGK